MKTRIPFIIGFFTLAVSCTPPFHSKEECQNELKQIENLPPNINGRQWNKTNIVVCWDDSVPLDENEKEYFQQIVKDGWEQYININFIGWGLCSLMVNPDVEIVTLVDDSGSTVWVTQGETDTIGMPKVNLFPDHVKINFDVCSDPITRDGCLQRTILHEFGHVLNLEHEQTRSDTPKWCKDYIAKFNQDAQSEVDTKQTLIGEWDQDSIMNYCNDNIERPSCLDIANVVFFYGQR